jgi:hypothetical protein
VYFKQLLSLPLLVLLVSSCVGGKGALQAPYQSCGEYDGCSTGTFCSETTLPASAGYTGSFCTNSCHADADCLQDLDNYAAICVNAQCYITCPTGNRSCPYGTGCLTFADSSGFGFNLCTP